MFTLLLAASLLLDPAFDHATVGAYAVRMDTGEVIVDENSNKSLVPASSLKAVTTAAALHILGPDFRFQTALQYDGEIEDGTLHGNLYIRGSGDPCLGSHRFGSWNKQMEMWVAAVKAAGIKKIQGQVFGDAAAWEMALAAPSWSWEDLGNYYGAGASALSFHENSYKLFFRPGSAVGQEAAVLRTEPPMQGFELKNEVKTGPVGSGDQACIYGTEFSPIQFVRGTVPAGVSEFHIKGAIPDPAKFCADLLGKILQSNGIEIQSESLPPKERVTIYTTDSPPLREIVYLANQHSINLYAESLLKKMGGGSTLGGTQAVIDFWKSKKIDLTGFNMVDGSGLSRKNLITPKQLVQMMIEMKKSDYFPEFFASLPEEKQGIRAKSGSMSLVLAYTGYAGNIAFAVIVNQQLNRKKMNESLDRFLVSLGEK